MLDIKALCVSAKQASYNLGGMAEDKKNKILTAIASSILSRSKGEGPLWVVPSLGWQS